MHYLVEKCPSWNKTLTYPADESCFKHVSNISQSQVNSPSQHQQLLQLKLKTAVTGISDAGLKWFRVAWNGTIRYFFRSEPECTKVWSEKIPGLSHSGSIWPTLGRNLTPLCLKAAVKSLTRLVFTWSSGKLTF